MAYPTILILGLLASGISVITCGFASHANEISVIPDENGTIDVPGGNFLPTGSITEMSYRGKVIIKKFTCPTIYGRYPHPESCEYYFECRFGWPTLWHCNRGYLYDREREQCRDRRNVKCRIGHDRDHDHHKDGKDNHRDGKDNHRDGKDNHRDGKDNHKDGKDREIDVKEDVRIFKCPYIWGTFAHPYDCSKYYVCIYNYPKLFQCYNNFLYDTHYRKCLPSNRVNCGNRLDRDQMRTSRRPAISTTVKPVEITTEKPGSSKFYCPFPYGRYPDPEDCSRYYECRFSIPHLYTCPESSLYDERKEQCLQKKKVKCGRRPGGNDEDVESEDDKNVSFRCPYVWGTFAHPVDCSKYIICIYNVPSIFNCRKNELFDSHYRRCLPKEKVSCDDRINPDDPYPSRKTTASPIFSTLTPSTLMKISKTTTSQKPTEQTTTPILTTESTVMPSSTTTPVLSTTVVPKISTLTTSVPTTRTIPTTTTSIPTTTSTTPTTTTTTTTTPVPTTTTTTTTTPVPTTTATTTTTPVPTTTIMTTVSTLAPTTEKTSPSASAFTTTTVPSESTTLGRLSTILPVTKPNTPPPTECDEDDVDCIIDGTGDVSGWFDCPKRFGHFPHGSSRQLFIHCDNWRPFIKKCAEHTRFSPTYLVCVWENKKQDVL